MRILALDTTSEFGSLALSNDGVPAVDMALHSRDGFGHVIFGAVDDALKQAGWGLHEIDCFAAANGPGSFTGVRVGLTVIKGLAEATQKPVAAISNLRALADFGSASRRVVMIDARRSDIYAAVYNEQLEPIVEDTVITLAAWLERLDEGEYQFITLAGEPLGSALAASRFSAMPHIAAPRSLAVPIARCALLDSLVGKLLSPLAADANYVRRSDAELFWRDR
jgi:tRNA threonylcarbamoyladenosine biosynthesis protein TsaB